MYDSVQEAVTVAKKYPFFQKVSRFNSLQGYLAMYQLNADIVFEGISALSSTYESSSWPDRLEGWEKSLLNDRLENADGLECFLLEKVAFEKIDLSIKDFHEAEIAFYVSKDYKQAPTSKMVKHLSEAAFQSWLSLAQSTQRDHAALRALRYGVEVSASIERLITLPKVTTGAVHSLINFADDAQAAYMEATNSGHTQALASIDDLIEESPMGVSSQYQFGAFDSVTFLNSNNEFTTVIALPGTIRHEMPCWEKFSGRAFPSSNITIQDKSLAEIRQALAKLERAINALSIKGVDPLSILKMSSDEITTQGGRLVTQGLIDQSGRNLFLASLSA